MEKSLTKYENQQIESLIQNIRGDSSTIQQYAIEAAHLMSATQDRLTEYKDSGFFKRLWYAVSGKRGELDRANQTDLIKIQQCSFAFLDQLYKQNMLMGQTISLVNNELKAIRFELSAVQDAVDKSNFRVTNEIVNLTDMVVCQRTYLIRRIDTLESRFACKLLRHDNQIKMHDWHINFYSRVREYEKFNFIFMLAIVFDCFESIKRQHISFGAVRTWEELSAAFANHNIDQNKEISLKEFFSDLLDQIRKMGYLNFKKLIPSLFFDPREKTKIQNFFVTFCWFVQTIQEWNSSRESFDNANFFNNPFSHFKDYFIKNILKSPDLCFTHLELADALLAGAMLSTGIKNSHYLSDSRKVFPHNQYKSAKSEYKKRYITNSSLSQGSSAKMHWSTAPAETTIKLMKEFAFFINKTSASADEADAKINEVDAKMASFKNENEFTAWLAVEFTKQQELQTWSETMEQINNANAAQNVNIQTQQAAPAQVVNNAAPMTAAQTAMPAAVEERKSFL